MCQYNKVAGGSYECAFGTDGLGPIALQCSTGGCEFNSAGPPPAPPPIIRECRLTFVYHALRGSDLCVWLCVCVCVCVYWQVPRLLRILPLQRDDCILHPCQVLPCHTSAIHRHVRAGPLRCHSCHTRHQQVVWVWRLASSRGLRDGTVRWHSRTARPCCGHSGRLRCSAWLVEGCTTRWRL